LPRVVGLPRDVIRLYEACATDDPQGRPSATEVAEALYRLTGPAPLARPVRLVPPLRYGARATDRSSGAAATASVPSARRPRQRAVVMASAAAVAVVVSIFGVQLANGTATPGGREAEAAVEGAHPATTSPKPGTPAPSPTTAQVREISATTPPAVRKKAPARGTTPVDTPTTTPANRPTTRPVTSPTTAPATTPPPVRPTPSRTPDSTPAPTDPPVEPTDPETTEPPEETTPPVETPPVTASPEAQDDSESLV
jgi:serine/threonine-protein kinase